MAVSQYHRRRWDEPRVSVEVEHRGAPCCGEVEARRTNDGRAEVFVRCTDETVDEPQECSGWVAWNGTRMLDVDDVSVARGHRE